MPCEHLHTCSSPMLFGRSNCTRFSPRKSSTAVLSILLLTLLLAATLLVKPAHGRYSKFESFTNGRSLLRRPTALPPIALAGLQRVLSTSTGPDDFAAMGQAVTDLHGVLELHDSTTKASSPPKASRLSQKLKSALLHLFPFVSSRYHYAFSDLEHHVQGSRGIVIPCGNGDFQVALHLIAAGEHSFVSLIIYCTHTLTMSRAGTEKSLVLQSEMYTNPLCQLK